MRAALIALWFVGLTISAGAQPAPSPLERGKYLVENVGMCGDCHTPRDAHGEPIAARQLKGAPLGFGPLHQMPFATAAPPIAGGPPGWTLAQLVHFLETGERPGLKPPRPPMPAYRFSPADAEAVATYLRSLH